MAHLVFSMNQSLDGYVDHDAFAPGPILLQHFIDHVGALSGSLYGARLYGIMRYWDEDRPEWEAPERAFARAWRGQPKWVASRTLDSVGPNASLVKGGLGDFVRRLKAERTGEIDVGGPVLAGELTRLGLIDEYRIYLHPVVLGAGDPYFAAARPPLRLIGHEAMGEGVVRLSYAPA